MFTFLLKNGKGFSGTHKSLTPYMVQIVQNIQGEESGTPTDFHHTPNFTVSITQPKILYTRRKATKNTELPQASVRMSVPDEVVLGDEGDMLVRAVTTASSLAAEQDSDNINNTQSKETSSEEGSDESNSNDGNPSQMANTGGSDDQTRFDAGFKSQDSPLGPGNTCRSDEDRPVTHELMDDTVHNDNVNDSPLRPGQTDRSDDTSMQLIQKLMVTCTNLELKCDTLEEKVLGLSTISDAQARQIKRLQRNIKNREFGL
jgi:hypothetical protein